MINKLLFILLLSTFIFSCSLESPIAVEKIDQIEVTDGYGNYLFDIELSDEITLPVELDEFLFILEECFNVSSFLSEIDIELEGNEWKTSFRLGFGCYRFVSVNRYNASMAYYDW